MKKIKYYLLFFTIAAALANCRTVLDPGVDYMQLIEKQSVEDLRLTYTAVDTNISVVIPSMSEFTLLNYSSVGLIRDYEDCDPELVGILYLRVESSDTLKVTINPNQSVHWQFTIFEENDLGGGSGECRLVIADEHIE